MDLSGDGVRLSRTSRTTCPALTSVRLGEVWPEVSERLHRLLASRGVDPSLREDIVQEVAVRALDKQVPFADPGDLYRWAATAARNLHVDHLRSGSRTVCDDALATVADRVDVAHAAERRVALDVVWRALAGMRPGERAAILDGLEEDRTPRTSQVLVRRHRARATLRKAVGGVLGWLGLARLRLRLRLRALGDASPALSAVAMLAPAVALQLGGVGVPPATTPSRAPVNVTRAAATSPLPRADRTRPAPPRVRAPRPAPAGHHAAVTGAVAAPPASPPPHPDVDVKGPGTHVSHYTEPPPEDASLLCYDWAEAALHVCVPGAPGDR
jgi:DNA-directed RNA polymerase specialized sigma24 family protein